MIDREKYFEMYDAVQRGDITQEVWVEYCINLLSDIMEKHKDVFIRLKNRDGFPETTSTQN